MIVAQALPTFNELIQAVQTLGIPTIAFAAGIWIGLKILNSGLSDHAVVRKAYEKSQVAIFEKDSEILKLQTELGDCRAEKGGWNAEFRLLEEKSNRAVNELLDDTQDFLGELERVTLMRDVLQLRLDKAEAELQAYKKAQENPDLGEL